VNVGISCIDCPVGRFSVNCGSECHCKNATEHCSQELGLCQSGCDDHWAGIGCQGQLYAYKYCLCCHVSFTRKGNWTVCVSSGKLHHWHLWNENRLWSWN